MIKPILIPVEYVSLAKLQGDLIVRDGKLYTCCQLNQLQLHKKVEGDRACGIIIIDTEAEIVAGDPMLFEDIRIERHFNWKDSSECNKIVAMSYKHKIMDTIPLLSTQSIQLLINHYNEHKCMPESVNVETGIVGMTDGWVPTYNDPDNSGLHPSAEPIYGIKLNQQSEVDITIPEVKHKSIKDCVASHEGDTQYKEGKLYTEEEVCSNMQQYLDEYVFSNETYITPQEWINSKNK